MCDEGNHSDTSTLDLLIAAVENRGLVVVLIFGCPYPGCEQMSNIPAGFDLSHRQAADCEGTTKLTYHGDYYETCF